METATTTYAAREGLRWGYGLALYAMPRNGFLSYGHNGGMTGALCEFSYTPDLGVGYVVMINTGNREALQKISAAVVDFITRDAKKPVLAPLAAAGEPRKEYEGWYEATSPRHEDIRFLVRLSSLSRIRIGDSELTWDPMLGSASRFAAVTDRHFRHEEAPIPSVALISDRSEGTFIQYVHHGGGTLQRIPAWKAWTALVVVPLTAFLCLATLTHAVIWIPTAVFRRRIPPQLRLHVLPLLAILTLLSLASLYRISMADPIKRLGEVTGWSIGIFALSVLFPALTLVSLGIVLKGRKASGPRLVWWNAFLTSAVLAIAAAYLAASEIVGIRTWT